MFIAESSVCALCNGRSRHSAHCTSHPIAALYIFHTLVLVYLYWLLLLHYKYMCILYMQRLYYVYHNKTRMVELLKM